MSNITREYRREFRPGTFLIRDSMKERKKVYKKKMFVFISYEIQ